MKNILRILPAVALLPFAAFGADAYSPVVGYTTQTLTANTFDLIGLNLHSPVVVSSVTTNVVGAVITDTAITFTSVLTSPRTYILEVTSGSAAGSVQEFTSWATNSFTLPGTLTGFGIGNSYSIRLAPTLEEIFGTTTSVLTKNANVNNADVVWVPDGLGNYARYYIRPSDSTFRNAVGGTAAPSVPVVYVDGVFVQKRGTGSSLVVSGELKKTSSTNAIVPGFNPIGTVYPAGSTLQNCGLDAYLTKNANVNNADVVWVPDGLGNYSRYYIRPSDSTWRNAIGGTAAPANLELPAAVFIQRRTGNLTYILTPPSTYTSL